MRSTEKLQAERHALAEQKRTLGTLLAKPMDDMQASERRAHSHAIADGEAECQRLERIVERSEAIQAAHKQIPYGEVPPVGWGATARGELYSEQQYRPDSGPSFFRDVMAARDDPTAQERLQRNQREGLAELHADVTTGDPGLTGLIPPMWLADMWAAIPRASRPFADAIGSRQLTEYGMTVSIPRVTTGASVDSQAAQGDAVSETDPDTDVLTAPVVTIAGQVDLSRQALERSLPNADTVIFGDLMAAYDAELDRQLIDGLGSGGEMRGILHMSAPSVAYTDGTPTAGEALVSIFDGIQTVATTRFLPAEAVLLHPRRGAWLASSLSTPQPLFPLGSASARALGTQNAGFSDDIAGLKVVLDPNVPTTTGASTNQDTIAVVRLSDLLLYEQPVRQLRYDAVLSGTLESRLQVYSYAAFIANRWPSSVCLVEGTGLANPW